MSNSKIINSLKKWLTENIPCAICEKFHGLENDKCHLNILINSLNQLFSHSEFNPEPYYIINWRHGLLVCYTKEGIPYGELRANVNSDPYGITWDVCETIMCYFEESDGYGYISYGEANLITTELSLKTKNKLLPLMEAHEIYFDG